MIAYLGCSAACGAYLQEPYSESELRLIYSFDVDKDLERLSRRVALRDNCLRTLRLATKLLQICARHHLTVRETATIAVRDDFDIPSPLEHLVSCWWCGYCSSCGGRIVERIRLYAASTTPSMFIHLMGATSSQGLL